jgi:hypothetical protein
MSTARESTGRNIKQGTTIMKFNRSALLSIGQVAWLTGGTEANVCRAIRVGVLPVVRRGGRVLIPACAVADLADSPVGGASR